MMLESLKTGFTQTLGNKRMLFLFYGVNVLFGGLLMFPMHSLLDSFAGGTVMAEGLAGRLDMDFLLEFVLKQGGAFSVLVGLAAVAALLYLSALLFLSGGAFSVFRNGGAWDAGTFWEGAGRHFGRFFRLALWTIPVFIILYLVGFIPRWTVLLLNDDPSEKLLFWMRVLRVVIGYLAIILSYAVFDYARIHTVATEERAMRRSIWRGIRFVFRRFSRTFPLALIVFLAGLAVLFVYNPIADSLHAPGAFVVILLFLLQQLYMVVRIALKLILYSGQTELYQTVQRAAEVPAVPAASEPGAIHLEPSAV